MTGEREVNFAFSILSLCITTNVISEVGLGEEEKTRQEEQRFGATPHPPAPGTTAEVLPLVSVINAHVTGTLCNLGTDCSVILGLGLASQDSLSVTKVK